MNPQAFWSSLDSAWKKFLTSEFEVEGPSTVKKLAREREVYLDENFASTTLEPLLAFEKLQELNCDAPKVSDLTPLTKLSRLETLRISSKAIKDFSPLARLVKLKSLELSDTGFADLSVVSKLVLLWHLNVSSTKVADLSPLAGLKKLEHLDVGSTRVTDLAPLSGLKKLRHLDLANLKVDSFAVLSTLPLHQLDAYGTNLNDLSFLTRKELGILDVRKTRVSFRDLLGVLASLQARASSSGVLLSSEFQESAAVLAELNRLDFSLEGLEPALAAVVHNAITSSLKAEKPADQQLAVKLLNRWLELPVSKVKHQFSEALASNAVVTLVRFNGSDAQVKATLALLPDPLTDKVLAFNLACLFAHRKDKAQLLRFAKVALANGQEAARFREDKDFAEFSGDPDFQKLLSAPQLPDPEAEPCAWWNTLPEDLRQRLSSWNILSAELDETKSNIFKVIHGKDFSISLPSADTLDHLRGLTRLKRLELSDVKARSIEPLGTLVGLEHLKFSPQKRDQAFDWSPLSRCEKLSSLALSHCVVDLTQLTGLTRLAELKLWYVTVASLDVLATMTRLTSLDLAIEGVVIDANLLAPLTKLTSLDVLNLGSLEPLKGLTKLTKLSVDVKSTMPVSLSPLASLTGLTDLTLRVPFTDATPLLALKSLRSLRLSKGAPLAAVRKLLKAQGCEVSA